MYYDEVFKALNKNKVRYAVAGGVAVTLHGFARFTADLDLIVLLNKENLGKFFDTLYRIGYRPRAPVTKKEFQSKRKRKEWITKKGMVVFSFFHNKDCLKIIDIFVDEPIPFAEIERKIEMLKIDKMTIPTVCIDHLKKLKSLALRPQDVIDIKNLEEIQRLRNEQS